MSERPITLVTGAAGGIGRACAEALAPTHALVITDRAGTALDQVAAGLREGGAIVAAAPEFDLGDPAAARRLVATTRDAGPLRAVVSAAGLSPALGDAAAILQVNLVATERLVAALEEGLAPGLVLVQIASMAGHVCPRNQVLDQLCEAPLAEGFLEQAVPLLGAGEELARQMAYNVSKRANQLMVQRRCAAWGAAGARLVTISPGLVDTLMGRAEVAATPGAARMLEATPLGWVQPRDVAATAAFLCSADARSISGCDLKVDGGVCAALFSGAGSTGGSL